MNDKKILATPTRQSRWNREVQVIKLEEIKAKMEVDRKSQRQIAKEAEVPRSTLQHWLERNKTIDAEPELVAFFESSVGLAFLHRLVLALHFCFRMLGNSGIRLISVFLEKAGLDAFVACSHHVQQQIALDIEKETVAFGAEEKQRLAPLMAPKSISVCEDENFHEDRICLVAIEPVSDMILVEQYSDHRDASAWDDAVSNALADLPGVKIIQATSDAAKGLLLHAKTGLGGAHHSPDLFHIQQDISKATAHPLASRIAQAEKKYSKAVDAKLTQEAARATFDDAARKKGSEQRPDFEQLIQNTEELKQVAVEELDSAKNRKANARQAVRGISEAYHPFDLQTGESRSADQVRQEVKKQFSVLRTIADAALLPEWSQKLIAKAQRQVDPMVATIAFFHHNLQASLESLDLTDDQTDAFLSRLVPGFYIQQRRSKTQQAENRDANIQVVERLLQTLAEPANPFSGLPLARLREIEKTAMDCANMFQRASSCVEGRNGQLALRHHHLHKISSRTLQSQTVIHNYAAERADGTTAAERFFGNKPRDLFGWLLDRIALPARPASV